VPLGLVVVGDALDLLGVADVVDDALDEPSLVVRDVVLAQAGPEVLVEVLPRGRYTADRKVLLVEEVVSECGELDDEEVDLGGRVGGGDGAGDGEGEAADASDVVEVVRRVVAGVMGAGELLCALYGEGHDGGEARRRGGENEEETAAATLCWSALSGRVGGELLW